MEKNTAEDLVDRALEQFYERDKFLLQKNVHERSIVHKFAEYLQQEFSTNENENIVVDCEYNREGHGNKKTLPEPETDNEEDQIYPDIILHERGTHENNYLVIEAKKGCNTDNRESDKERLEILIDSNKRYNYDIGLFLIFYTNSNHETNPEKDWYTTRS